MNAGGVIFIVLLVDAAIMLAAGNWMLALGCIGFATLVFVKWSAEI